MIDFQLSEAFSKPQKQALRKILSPLRIKRWVTLAMERPHPQDTLTIRVVDDAEGRQLNKNYRGKNYATNVLTFEYLSEPFVSADLVFCASVIEQEAKAQNKSLEEHWAHLVVHGVLHAQGYDHETHEDDAFEMETLESLLLMSLGYVNPYA